MDRVLLGGMGGVHAKDARSPVPWMAVKREGEEGKERGGLFFFIFFF